MDWFLSIRSLKISDGTIIQDSQGKCEVLAKVLAELSNLKDDGKEVPDFPDRIAAVLHHVNYCTPKVLRPLQSLDVTKSMGPDNIPNIVLETCGAKLAELLSSLFQLYFYSGTFA